MGSRTYETALDFEAKGFGWSYGDKPTFVLTRRNLPKTRDTVELYSGDLTHLVNERLKPSFRSLLAIGLWSAVAIPCSVIAHFITQRLGSSKYLALELFEASFYRLCTAN
jgi:hypothetical protein